MTAVDCRICYPYDCDDPDRHLGIPDEYSTPGCYCGAASDGRDCMCFENDWSPEMREPIPRPVSTNATPEELARYKADYRRGWRYSSTSPDPSLDHLDRKRARDAEYDGYLDCAAGRDKWHLMHCDGTCPGQH